MEPIRKLDYTPQVIDQGSIICHDVALTSDLSGSLVSFDKGTRTSCSASGDLSACGVIGIVASQLR